MSKKVQGKKKISKKSTTHKSPLKGTSHKKSTVASHDASVKKRVVTSKSAPRESIGAKGLIAIAVIFLVLIFGLYYFIVDPTDSKITNTQIDSSYDLAFSGGTYDAVFLSYSVENDSIVVETKSADSLVTVSKDSVAYLMDLFTANGYSPTKEDVMNEALVREMLYFNADKSVDDETATEQILNNAAFKARLIENGISSEEFVAQYKEEIVKDYVVQKYFNEQILSIIPNQEGRNTNHILVCYEGAQTCTENRTKEEAYALALEIKTMAEENNTLESFESLALELSDGPSSVNGGDLGLVLKGYMVPEFEDATFDLDVEEISDPVETVFGYHIIRVNSIEMVPNSEVAINLLSDIKDKIIVLAEQKS